MPGSLAVPDLLPQRPRPSPWARLTLPQRGIHPGMMLVAFVAPYLLDATTRFAEATAGLPGVDLALITCEPADRVPEQLRHRLAAHWRIDDPLDTAQIARGVQAVNEHVGRVQRLIGVFEHLQVPIAQVREQL